MPLLMFIDVEQYGRQAARRPRGRGAAGGRPGGGQSGAPNSSSPLVNQGFGDGVAARGESGRGLPQGRGEGGERSGQREGRLRGLSERV